MPWDLTEGFEYVVNPLPPAKVHFGSGLYRDCNPITGPSCTGFVGRMTPTFLKDLDFHPTDYGSAFYNTLNKPSSNRGTLPLVDKPPFKQLITELPPSPEPESLKQNCAPFNSLVPRDVRLLMPNVDYPASCEHSAPYVRQEMKFEHSFGGKKTMICPVEIQCVPFNLDECIVCGCLCTNQGDYWHLEHRIFMCRKHYNMFYKKKASEYHGNKLEDFKPVRDCFFMHKHFSSMAHLTLVRGMKIKRKLWMEAYLDLFFPQRKLKVYP